METATLMPEERANGYAVVSWLQERMATTEVSHSDADTSWGYYWRDFETAHWLRHALHCMFPPADTLPAWERVRNASGFFSGDISFSFTNGFARLPFAKNEVREEWDCNDLDPYVVVFRIEPDWCLAETADADLVVYEGDLEKLVCLHDWKNLHIAVVHAGRIAEDFLFSSGGIFVDGFSLREDGSLAIPEDVHGKLSEAGFATDIRLPHDLMD